MFNINKRYLSLYEKLVELNFPLLRSWVDRKYYGQEFAYAHVRHDAGVMPGVSPPFGQHRRWHISHTDPTSYPRWGQFIGAFQKLADIPKGIRNTFRPFKHRADKRWTLLQPVRGLGNIARGLLTLTMIAPMLVGLLFYFTIQDMKQHWQQYQQHDEVSGWDFVLASLRSFFLKGVVENIFLNLTWAIDGVSSLVRGILQVPSAVLLILVYPLRAWLIPLLRPAPLIEQNASIVRLVEMGEQALKEDDASTYAYVHFVLAAKVERNLQRGQSTHLRPSEEVLASEDARELSAEDQAQLNKWQVVKDGPNALPEYVEQQEESESYPIRYQFGQPRWQATKYAPADRSGKDRATDYLAIYRDAIDAASRPAPAA